MLVTVGDVGIVNGVVPVLLLTSQTGNLVNCFNNASLEHEGKALGTHLLQITIKFRSLLRPP